MKRSHIASVILTMVALTLIVIFFATGLGSSGKNKTVLPATTTTTVAPATTLPPAADGSFDQWRRTCSNAELLSQFDAIEMVLKTTQDQQIKISFGDAIATGGKGEGTKQYGKESDVIKWSQDGYSAGTVTNLSFNDAGILTASYTNGQVVDLGQILLAKFENPEALFKQGGNLFKQSRDAGEPSLGGARQSGRGSIMAKSLERSTVDIASEFVSMITNTKTPS